MISLSGNLRLVVIFSLIAWLSYGSRGVKAGELTTSEVKTVDLIDVVKEKTVNDGQETRGGPGYGIRCGKNKTLYSVAYLKTNKIKKIKALVGKGKYRKIKLKPGIPLPKQGSQSIHDFCVESLSKIQNRFNELAKAEAIDVNRKEMCNTIANSIQTYIDTILDPKNNEQSVDISDVNNNIQATSDFSKQDIFTISDDLVRKLQLTNQDLKYLQKLKCDQSSLVLLNSYHMTVKSQGNGAYLRTHTFANTNHKQAFFGTGMVNGDISDYQCSYHHMHEILRLFLNDSAAIDIYLPILHSEFFLKPQTDKQGRDYEIAYLLAPESNPQLKHLRSGRIDTKYIDALNPILTFPDFIKNMIDEAKLLELGLDPFLALPNDGEMQRGRAGYSLRELGNDGSPRLRTYSLQMLHKYMMLGPSMVETRKRVLSVGDTIIININGNEEKVFIYGFTPEESPIMMRDRDLTDAQRDLGSGNSLELPLWILPTQ